MMDHVCLWVCLLFCKQDTEVYTNKLSTRKKFNVKEIEIDMHVCLHMKFLMACFFIVIIHKLM